MNPAEVIVSKENFRLLKHLDHLCIKFNVYFREGRYKSLFETSNPFEMTLFWACIHLIPAFNHELTIEQMFRHYQKWMINNECLPVSKNVYYSYIDLVLSGYMNIPKGKKKNLLAYIGLRFHGPIDYMDQNSLANAINRMGVKLITISHAFQGLYPIAEIPDD